MFEGLMKISVEAFKARAELDAEKLIHAETRRELERARLETRAIDRALAVAEAKIKELEGQLEAQKRALAETLAKWEKEAGKP